ncbi:MAG TPA: DUF1028 domain-containing protein [Aggregatilineales bacterium]|nr:DUF1028 domain-containing protein [Aggregatilineales bacterium]
MGLSTFSIIAADPQSGEVGVAVQSKFLCVGAVVPWARGGIGAVATQASAETSFGPRGLELLQQGYAPGDVIEALLSTDESPASRQFAVIDNHGRVASHTGGECFEHAGSLTGVGYACQGNLLATANVVPAMAHAFESASDLRLAERMIAALQAGQQAGGDRRGQESAALLVVKPGGGYGGKNDRYIDLRVDHHDRPIDELEALLGLHRLYFDRPSASEIVAVDAALESEIALMLALLGKQSSEQRLWRDLEDYMSWENLEERWVGAGFVDQRVLAYLREHAAGQRR